MLRIVTDGAADMPAGWEKEYDIQIIPINMQFGERTLPAKSRLEVMRIFTGWWKRVERFPRLPSLLRSSSKIFYESVAKVGDTILSLHVTSKLSGTFESR